MRLVALAGATLALALTAAVAHADSNYGPRRQGNQCWHNQGWNSLGYWGPCETTATTGGTGGTAEAKVARKKKK
jgi:hypothetical protein